MNNSEAIKTLRTLGFDGEIRAYEKGNMVFFYSYRGHIASLMDNKIKIHIPFISKNKNIQCPICGSVQLSERQHPNSSLCDKCWMDETCGYPDFS